MLRLYFIRERIKSINFCSTRGTKGSRTIFFEPPRTEMGGSQTCGCSMEEGHAPLDPFCRQRPHPYAGGSAPGGGVLPSACGCKTNQKPDKQALVLTTMQCATLGGVGRIGNAGGDQGNADDVGCQ
jgi:hypothetical protein